MYIAVDMDVNLTRAAATLGNGTTEKCTFADKRLVFEFTVSATPSDTSKNHAIAARLVKSAETMLSKC